MKILTNVSRFLLGFIFLVFGLNGFLHFIPMPPPSGVAGQFLGAMFVTKYLLVVSGLQVISGALLLINRYVPLALTILGPIIVNILLFHGLMNPAGVGLAVFVAILWGVVFVSVRSAFAGIFQAGVEHYVYTSVGSAHKRTGIPHFDNKWRIEETVRGLRFPSHVILRPVFFMENLLAPYSLQGDTLAWALGPGTKLQMIALDDIGSFGARAFTDAAVLNRREIDLAGDVRAMPEAAEILTEALGRPIAFAQTPIEQVRQYSEDTALMLQWFERVGYSADIAGLEREFGRALTKLPDWARRHARPNWR